MIKTTKGKLITVLAGLFITGSMMANDTKVYAVVNGENIIPVRVDGKSIITFLDVSDRQRRYLLAGGALNFVKNELNTVLSV